MDRPENQQGGESPANRDASRRLSDEVNGSRKWTVAIDLATNLEGKAARAVGAGAQDKWNQLRELATETITKPVAFIVSVSKPVDADAVALGSMGVVTAKTAEPKADQPDAPSPMKNATLEANAARKPLIETFVIEKGEIRQIESAKSEGTAQDIEHLLKVTAAVAPSEKLGLVVFAHGTGQDEFGIVGDAGKAPLPAVQAAIANGLGDRSRLDVLIFDGCRMATVDTAARVENVASNLVVSQDEEITLMEKHTDGITLNASMHSLLQAPGMTGRELAQDFITQAKAGVNGVPAQTIYDKVHLRSSVDTLSALDLSKFSNYQTALNQLGGGLDRALTDSENEKAIAAAIDKTGSMPSRFEPYWNYQRDTHQFAEKILEQVHKGVLKDDGTIAKLATDLVRAQDAMVIDRYGSSNYYQKMGGINVELPSASASSQLTAARESTVLGLLISDLKESGRIENRDSMVSETSHALMLMKLSVDQSFRDDIPRLSRAAANLRTASEENYQAALKEVIEASQIILDQPAGKRWAYNILNEHPYKASSAAGIGWSTFVNDIANYELQHGTYPRTE